MSSKCYEIRSGSAEVARLLENRHSDIFQPPDSWQDARFHGHRPSALLTVDREITISKVRHPLNVGEPLEETTETVEEPLRSTFFPKEMRVKICPETGGGTAFQRNKIFTPATIANSSASHLFNCITTGSGDGKVRISEHIMASRALGISNLYDVSASSMPSPFDVLDPLNNAMAPYLVAVGETTPITVREPVAVEFKNGAYLAALPPSNRSGDSLIMDHQFDHQKNCLGAQRFRAEMSLPLFGFIDGARAPSYGLFSAAGKALLKLRPKAIPFLDINKDRILFVRPTRLLNPNPKYVVRDKDGALKNREALAHEVIDELGALGLATEKHDRFTGEVFSDRLSHKCALFAWKIIRDYFKP